MANVITQFLVGIGLDTTEFEKGEKRVHTAMEGVKSSTLAIGSAMASAAIGAGVRVDQLAEKSRKLQDQLYRTNTQTTWAQGYGASLRELGGNADDAVGRITGLEDRLASIRMGEGGGWLDALGKAGFDAGQLAQARSSQEFITMASDQFARASHTQQVNMAAVLDLTDQEFRLWQQGGQYVDAHSKKLAEQLGYTDALNQKQYEYSQEWIKVNQELDRAGNIISTIMLPGMTTLVKLAGEYTGKFADFAKENPDAASAAVGAGTGAAILTGGKVLSRIPGLGFLGPVGAATGGGVAANEAWNSIMSFSDNTYGTETTAGGNLKSESPLGKFYNWLHSEDTTNNSSPEWLTKPTHGAEYAPYSMPSPDIEQGYAVARALKESPIQVNNNVKMTGKVELDGRVIGEIIDTRIDENNEQSMNQFSTRVDR